jgi:hypothetical protein
MTSDRTLPPYRPMRLCFILSAFHQYRVRLRAQVGFTQWRATTGATNITELRLVACKRCCSTVSMTLECHALQRGPQDAEYDTSNICRSSQLLPFLLFLFSPVPLFIHKSFAPLHLDHSLADMIAQNGTALRPPETLGFIDQDDNGGSVVCRRLVHGVVFFTIAWRMVGLEYACRRGRLQEYNPRAKRLGVSRDLAMSKESSVRHIVRTTFPETCLPRTELPSVLCIIP